MLRNVKRKMKLGLPLLGLLTFAGYVSVETAAYNGRLEGPEALGTLEARVVVQSAALGFPIRVAVVDGLLAVIEESGGPAVHLIEPTGGSIRSLGGRGDGPCEFQNPFSIDVDGEGTGFWVFDVTLGRRTHVVPSGRQRLEWDCSEVLNLRSDAFLFGSVWLPDRETVVSLGLQSTGRLAYFDSAGRLLRVAGDVPGAEEGTPPAVRQQAYQGELKRKPDGSMLAVALRNAGWIELFSPDGRRVGTAQGPEDFGPVYQVLNRDAGPIMEPGFGMRLGYVDAATTDDYIIGLYSGLAKGQVRDAYMGRQIHFFDWSGEFLGGWRLDTPVIAIAVSEVDRTIYALRHDPVPAVVAFDLPDLPALIAGFEWAEAPGSGR